MKRETKKRLTARDLKVLGASSGLVVRRVPPPLSAMRRAKGARRA